MEMLVNNGLNVRSLAEVAHHIVELKFNCVRLPYSLDSLNLSAVSIPHPASQLCHNPELQVARQRILKWITACKRFVMRGVDAAGNFRLNGASTDRCGLAGREP